MAEFRYAQKFWVWTGNVMKRLTDRQAIAEAQQVLHKLEAGGGDCAILN